MPRLTPAAAAAVLAGVGLLSSCAPAPASTLADKYHLSNVHAADRAEVNGLVDDATSVLLRGGTTITYRVGGKGNNVTVVRYDNRVELTLAGLRFGTAGQVRIGDKQHPATVTAYDNGRRKVCQDGHCANYTHASSDGAPANLADVADAGDVLVDLLPVTPAAVERVNSMTDQAFEHRQQVLVGDRTTAVGPARCVAVADADGTVAPELCVLSGFVGTGTPVDRGAHDDGTLSYDVVGLTTA